MKDYTIPDIEHIQPVTDALLVQVFKGKVDNAAGIVSTTHFDYAKIGLVLKAGPKSDKSDSFAPGDRVLFRRNLSDPYFLSMDGEVIDCHFISSHDVVAKIVHQ